MVEKIEIIINRNRVKDDSSVGDLISIFAYDEDDDSIECLEGLTYKQAQAIVTLLMAALHKGN